MNPIKAVIKKVYFRPILSPIRPKINAPSGLIRKPMVNKATVSRNADTGLALEKNCCDRTLARLPKI